MAPSPSAGGSQAVVSGVAGAATPTGASDPPPGTSQTAAPGGQPSSSVPASAAPVGTGVPSAPPAAQPAPSGSDVPSTPSPSPSPTAAPVAPAPTLVAVVDLPSNPARRRAQTWEAPAPPWTLEGYQWPLPKGIITDPFGPSPWGSRLVNGQLFHDGIDVATVCGDRIVAAHEGVVLAAGRKFDSAIGWVGDLGPYTARLDEKKLWWSLPITVVIDDGNGYRSIYAHFSQVVVKPGQRVKAGQPLGYEGATGRATGCHLHYGLFAPHETATFAIEPSVVERMLVPPFQIARIDPLLVLPKRPGDETPTPAPGSTPTPAPGSTPVPGSTPAPGMSPVPAPVPGSPHGLAE